MFPIHEKVYSNTLSLAAKYTLTWYYLGDLYIAYFNTRKAAEKIVAYLRSYDSYRDKHSGKDLAINHVTLFSVKKNKTLYILRPKNWLWRLLMRLTTW